MPSTKQSRCVKTAGPYHLPQQRDPARFHTEVESVITPPFLRLPLEVRRMVYMHLLLFPETIVPNQKPESSPVFMPFEAKSDEYCTRPIRLPLMTVNRQIGEEASRMFYEENVGLICDTTHRKAMEIVLGSRKSIFDTAQAQLEKHDPRNRRVSIDYLSDHQNNIAVARIHNERERLLRIKDLQDGEYCSMISRLRKVHVEPNWIPLHLTGHWDVHMKVAVFENLLAPYHATFMREEPCVRKMLTISLSTYSHRFTRDKKEKLLKELASSKVVEFLRELAWVRSVAVVEPDFRRRPRPSPPRKPPNDPPDLEESLLTMICNLTPNERACMSDD